MVEEIRTPDKRASKLFEWDSEQLVLSIVHRNAVLKYELTEDRHFVFQNKVPKPEDRPPPKAK